MGNEEFIRGMWEYFTLKREEAKKILEDALWERQEGIQGQWQQEFRLREILEQVRGNADMGCGSQMMQRGYFAMRDGSWEQVKERYREVDKSSERTLQKIREAHEKVARDEIGRLGIVQENTRKSTDFLRRVIAPVAGKGGVIVENLHALQEFSFGRLHLVGMDGPRRQQKG